MTQNVLPHTEEVLPLLCEDLVDEVRRVLGVGSLVSNDQSTVNFAQFHLIFQLFLFLFVEN